MKKFLLFLSIFYSISAAAQWEWQNPLPQGNELNAVHFVDTNEGWAVGLYGTIMHTIDGGNNWEILSLGTTETFYDVTFIGPDTGWMVGYNMIYYTNNGGEIWNEQELPVPMYCQSVCFINVRQGWIVGSNFKIIHTENGGESWEEQDSGMGSEYGSLLSAFFIDENLGWASGWKSVILKTENGGVSWTQTHSGYNDFLRPIFFINDNVGWVAGGDYILKSVDGGDSWIQIASDLHNISGMYFTDVLTGWTCGGNGEIYKTSDGGQTWELVASDAMMHLNDIQFLDTAHGYTAGQLGKIQSYNQNLNTWESLTYGFKSNLSEVLFLNENEGWVAGYYLHHTKDGGKTWEQQLPGAEQYINCVHFEDSLNGWAASAKQLFRTRDGGENWSLQLSLGRNYDTSFCKLFFTDTLHGWALDFYGLLFHTRNGGNTWEQQFSGILDIQQNSLYAYDSLTAWIAGGYGVISKTTNGGENWTAFNTGFQWSMNWDIQFIDPQHGWMIDDGVFYSEDGGSNWDRISNTFGYAIHFIDAYQGWMALQSGGVARTQDGGYTWGVQNKPNYQRILDVWFTDENNGWAVGQSGIILHTYNGGTVGTNEFKVQSAKFKVECFPNPLSSVTTIRYDLPGDAVVSLEIFDNTGRRIDNLVNSNQLRGKHEVKWNAENLSTGIYFYRISTYNQSATGKLVVIK